MSRATLHKWRVKFGYTGPQFIKLHCLAADYNQRGQYVSSVANATNDAAVQRLLVNDEKARFVREAAKSKL